MVVVVCRNPGRHRFVMMVVDVFRHDPQLFDLISLISGNNIRI